MNKTKSDTPVLKLGLYRLIFRVVRGFEQPMFSGSAWRGAFGHALRRAVCVTRGRECAPCMLYRSCAYPYIFETPPDDDAIKMRRYQAAPHPFTFDLPWNPKPKVLSAGGELVVSVSLIGKGNRQLPYVIHALQRAGEEGLGKMRVPMVLESVEQEQEVGSGNWSLIHRKGGPLQALPAQSPAAPPLPESIALYLRTSLRLKHDRSLVTPERFEAASLLGPLVRRISMLTYFHTDTPLETDFCRLADQARQGRVLGSDLKWQEWGRYSSRQKTAMKMGGLLGEVELSMEGIENHWPYLWLGQWTHVGKGASMGLGRYSIKAASLPERTENGA